ncbi:MAG TPA: hypothetical protein VKQ72_08845 [Aggregatilineales bacterium]|nr:hypothetical protein [Aggregatilineales bacterium]
MSDLMEEVISEIHKLPEEDQDALAQWIRYELESEQRWKEAFAASEDILGQMADEALAEHRAGKTLPLDPDTL